MFVDIVRKLRVLQIAAAVILVVAFVNQVRLMRVMVDAFDPVALVALIEVTYLVGFSATWMQVAAQRVRDVRHERVRAKLLGFRTTRAPWMKWL